jgi:hypothetical protein
MSSSRTARNVVLCSLVLAGLSCLALAQFSAAVQGVVTDTTGGVLPGVDITLQNAQTGQTLKSVSNDVGFYRIGGLAPGVYTMTVQLPAFQKKVIEDINISAEGLTGLNVQLAPAGVQSAITVTGDAVGTAATENPDLARSITTQEVLRLPDFGRDPYELLRLTPGVFGTGARDATGNAVNLPNAVGPGGSDTSIFQVENQVQVTANGQRVSANNFELDGVNVNSLTWGGAAVVTPNQESVSEVRVLSTSYSAEDGRNSGVQVKVVSKSGGNDLSGSLFFKYQDPSLNAFNKYGGPGANPVRVTRRFRQFGGSVGGPIIHDRFFYFFSYEGLRSLDTNFSTAWVETTEYRQAVTALRPNSVTAKIFAAPGILPRITQVIPTDCSVFGTNAPNVCRVVSGGLDIGSITGALGQYVPLEDPTGGGFDGVPDIQFVQLGSPNHTRGDQFNPRFDYDTENHHFTLSMYFTRRNDLQSDPSGDARPMADLAFKPLNSAATFLWNSVWSPTMVNQARLNFSRFAYNQVKSSTQTDFGIPRVEVESYPFDRIRFGAPRSETTPGVFAQNTYGVSDTFSMVRGRHGLKFGGELQWEQDNNNLLGGARPDYSFTGLFNLANDTPIFEAINADPNTGSPTDLQRYFRTRDYALFVQDDWKVRPNLTVNLGLRWEYYSPLTEKQGRITNLVFGANGLVNSRVDVFNRLYDPDRNNFGPRLGFAWSPAAFKDKLVARGGFAVYYNRIPTVVFDNTRGNPPFFARYNLCCGTAATDFGSPFANGQIVYTLGGSNSPFSYPTNPALAPGIDPITGAPKGVSVEIYGAQRNLPNPYVYEYSFELEYSLPARFVMGLGYQGSAGHHLIRTVNLNFLYTPNPAFFAVYFPLPDVNSDFNGMNLRLQRKFIHGLQVDAAYRWSKSLDHGSGEFGAATNQTYPIDLKSERGPSDFDVTHYFVVSALWDVPFPGRHSSDWKGKLLGGWQLNSVFSANSGFPWTPKTGQPLSIPTLSPTRPTKLLKQPLTDHSNDAFIRPGGDFPGGGSLYFDIVTPGPPGIGRNSFRGPHYRSVDFSLIKDIHFLGMRKEDTGLEIRANFFNAFNTLNLLPFNFSSPGTFVENNLFFGRSEGGMAGRVIEFQVRLAF